MRSLGDWLDALQKATHEYEQRTHLAALMVLLAPEDYDEFNRVRDDAASPLALGGFVKLVDGHVLRLEVEFMHPPGTIHVIGGLAYRLRPPPAAPPSP